MDSRTHNEGSGGAKPGATAGHHPAPSKSELLSSAKVLGEAAKGMFGNNPSKTDKAELSAAAADLLNAASHYGKMDEKGMGKYVEKAEDYLHKYSTSHSTTAAAPGHHSPAAGQGHSSGGSGGGYGEYIKMAEGMFNKNSTHESSPSPTTTTGHSENKYGEYAKMAGDFLKKH